MRQTWPPRPLSYPALRWLLAPVAALHNLEEWLTFPIFGEVGGVMAATLGLQVARIPWEATELALLLVTIAPVAIVFWASLGRERRAKDFVVLWIAGIFLANVLAPHVPAAILAGGYSPGVASAVAINLPFCILLFRAAVRERVLSPGAATLAGVLGAVSLPFLVVGALALSAAVTGVGR